MFHVMKYAQLKTRSRVTGRKPEDYFQFSALPDPVSKFDIQLSGVPAATCDPTCKHNH